MLLASFSTRKTRPKILRRLESLDVFKNTNLQNGCMHPDHRCGRDPIIWFLAHILTVLLLVCLPRWTSCWTTARPTQRPL
jgi:hypothetical protein